MSNGYMINGYKLIDLNRSHKKSVNGEYEIEYKIYKGEPAGIFEIRKDGKIIDTANSMEEAQKKYRAIDKPESMINSNHTHWFYK